MRKDLQGLHHEKAELQGKIEQRGSELTASTEEVEEVRASLLAKSSEAEQAQGLAEERREEVARLEGRCQVRWWACMYTVMSIMD